MAGYSIELTTPTGTDRVSASTREAAIATIAEHFRPVVPRGIADKAGYASIVAVSTVSRAHEFGLGYGSVAAASAKVTVS